MKHGSRNIRARHASAHKGLDIRFGENPASAGYWINGLMSLGKAVEFLNGNTQEYGHLIDKGAGPTSAVTVHANIKTAFSIKKDELGIFPSNIHQCLDI